jgi:hypothetical protein
MYIVHNINDFDINDVYFNRSVNNTVLNNGRFTRVLYSTELYAINSLLYNIKITDMKIDHNYNKYKCFFSKDKNKNICSKLLNLENEILEYSGIKKNKQLCIANQIDSGCIKLFENGNTKQIKELILKISGIWETNYEYGLTYKFILLNPYI